MSCNLLPGANLQRAQTLPKNSDLKIQIEWFVRLITVVDVNIYDTIPNLPSHILSYANMPYQILSYADWNI